MREWLEWVAQLGGAKNHEALLVADCATQWSDCLSIVDLAQAVFGRVELAATDKSVSGWPAGSNALFRHAAEEMNRRGQPFFWIEPDAIPLKSGWLDAIEAAYKTCGKPFMRQLYKSSPAETIPADMMSGIGVYPADTIKTVGHLLNGNAWDVSIAKATTPHTADTSLIQSHWGALRSSPTFVQRQDRTPPNAFTLQALHPDAVLFHRNKDGTLIHLLREKIFPANATSFVVVFPFFHGDAPTACQTMEWIAELTRGKTHDVLLWQAEGRNDGWLGRIQSAARRAFRSVSHATYRSNTTRGFNGGWLHAAQHMAQINRPWLWMESDVVPLKPDWLQVIQQRYDRCGREFMGPIIPDMGHMNGTGVYPPNVPQLCPNTIKAMQSTDYGAWDMTMKPEMIHRCHDCSDIFQHAWVERGGNLQPHGHGEHPTFRDRQSLRRLLPNAVLFHRSKDGTLIQRLREIRSTL